MVVITDDPDPTFAAPFEPDALVRERCAVCDVAMAVLKCSACRLRFCVACERAAHDTQLSSGALKREPEETKSAGDVTLVHQEHVVAVNLCQICTQKSVEFLCIDCGSYQCEQCCAGRHLNVNSFSAHFFFCVEGSAPGLLRYAQWSLEFLEMAKMSHRIKLQRREDERVAAAQVKLEATQTAAVAADTPTVFSPPQTPENVPCTQQQQPSNAEERIAKVKMERPHDAPTETQVEVPPAEPIRDMEALSIAEMSNAVKSEPPIVQQQQQQQPLAPHAQPSAPASKSPLVELTREPASSSMKLDIETPVPTPAPAALIASASSSSSVIVDLTEDDDEADGVKSERLFSPSLGQFGVSEQAARRGNSAWLQAAVPSLTTATGGSTVGDSVILEDDDMSDAFEDPIKRMMVSEYNRLSEAIFNYEQEVVAIQKQIKDLLTNRSANMNEVVQFSNAAAQVKSSIVAETQNRNAAVARLVVYLKQDHAELNALLDASSVDIPHIQAASHRRCAQLEAIIRGKRFEIRQLKHRMEEAISMKTGTPFEEVGRLGAMVAAAEQVVRESEEARLVELIRLVQFSSEIRAAARALAATS